MDIRPRRADPKGGARLAGPGTRLEFIIIAQRGPDGNISERWKDGAPAANNKVQGFVIKII